MTWRGKLLTSAGSLLVLLCLLELGARVAFPEWAPTRAERRFWVHDSELGWRHAPNRSGRFTHPDFTISVSINSHGHRDREYSYERTPGLQRMLLVGDSFAWGFGVEEGETFHSVLEERHPDWEIINTSVSGYGTDQQYLYFQRDGQRYEPDVVLLLFNETDLHNNHHAVQHWHHKPMFGLRQDRVSLLTESVPRPSFVQRLDKLFFSRTYFMARVYGSVRSMLRGGARSTRGTPAEKRIELTARLVVALRDAVEARSARFFLASAPFSDAELRTRWLDRMEAEGVENLTLESVLEAAPAGDIYFEHDAHWTPRGHALVADALDAWLFSGDVLH